MADPDHPPASSDQRAPKAPKAKGVKVSTASKAEAKVLQAFLDPEGRLVRLPARRGKRLVVLDHLARVFEPGVKYPETDVNALLRAFGDDVALLRRSLVDEGFLARKGGKYWRSGGSVDVDADADRGDG